MRKKWTSRYVRTAWLFARACVRAFACVACVYACVRVRARLGVRVKVVPVWRCTATVDGKAFAFTVYGFDQVMPAANSPLGTNQNKRYAVII